MSAAPPYDAPLALAHRLADAAGEIQKRYFRTRLRVDAKADASPVTIVDREAEAAMRELIGRTFPDHGIYGEEHGVDRADAEFVWVLDPIDGTKSFITGRPLFGTLIGLLHAGRPVLGVVDHAILGERWTGVAGEPSLHNGAPIRVRPCPAVAEAVLYSTSPMLFEPGAERAAFDRVAGRAQLTMFGGDCYSYGLLALGFADLVVEAGLEAYDFTAIVPVVTGAGGVMTDWQGGELGLGSDGRVIAAGDGRAHAETLALLAAAGE